METSLIEEWVVDIEDALHKPDIFKFVGFDVDDDSWQRQRGMSKGIVIPAVLKDKYDQFSTRALAHAKTRGEHEIASLFNFYIIYKYKLWRAECDSWSEYTNRIGEMPFGMAKSTLEHGVTDIQRAMLKGLSVREIISSMAVSKGATLRLLELPAEQLPDGDIHKAVELVTNSGPSDAHRTIDDWEQKTKIHALTSQHDSINNRLYFDIRIITPDGAWKRKDYMIADIELEEAEWFLNRISVPKNKRIFK